MKNSHFQKGFTLIELLVVISIIGVLASITLVSLNDARKKARDATRTSDIKQIAAALELYYIDHGNYPNIIHGLGYDTTCGGTPGCGHCNRWCTLATLLKPYIDPLPREPLGDTTAIYYSYSAVPGDSWQKYGLSAVLEKGGSADGGYYNNAFETGPRVIYCMSKYSGTGRDWLWTSPPGWSYVCKGGN